MILSNTFLLRHSMVLYVVFSLLQWRNPICSTIDMFLVIFCWRELRNAMSVKKLKTIIKPTKVACIGNLTMSVINILRYNIYYILVRTTFSDYLLLKTFFRRTKNGLRLCCIRDILLWCYWVTDRKALSNLGSNNFLLTKEI